MRTGTSWAACLLWAACPWAPLAAQQPSNRAVETPIDFNTGQDDNLYLVLRSQDNIHAYEQGLAEIAAGDHRAGVERLHRLLLTENGGVVAVSPGRYLGLRQCVITAMANLPAAARQEYERLVASEGGAVGPLTELDDERLRLLAERFPTADVGRRARLRLGDLALTAGDAHTAAGHFRMALDAAEIGSAEEARVLERLRVAAVLSDPAVAHAGRKGGGVLADDGLLPIVPFAAHDRPWSAYGGGHAGNTPMVSLPGRPGTRWNESLVAPGFTGRDSGVYAMHAVGDLDGIFVNTGQSVVALDPLRTEIAWVSLSPMGNYEQEAPTRQRQRFGRGDFANGTGINEDMVLAAAYSGDVVVAALQVPEKSANVDFHGGFRVMTKIPMRRLYAFARQSGKMLWSHYDELDGPRTRRFRGHDACANPLIAGDTVYVPIHDRSGAIAFSIGAYDLQTGQPKWRRLVCSSQQDVNMFGNARAEFAASPLCLHDGVLYGASNLGVAFAVDAATGQLRWISAYEVTSMPHTSFHQQQDRQVYFANNAPVVADGVVCLTPLDSPFVLGLESESGRTLWRIESEPQVGGVVNRLSWVAGAIGDEFVLTGAGAVAAKARPAADGSSPLRQLVRPEALRDRSQLYPPRPAVTADGVWFARGDELIGFDPQGKPLPGSPVAMPRTVLGNLLMASGIVVSLRQGMFTAAYDAAALRERVEAAVKGQPDDPALLLRLACLRDALLGEGADPAAAATVLRTLEDGLAAAERRGLPKSHPVRLSLQKQLFAKAKARAEAAKARGDAQAPTLLAAARDAAPDEAQWIDMQAQVLATSSDPAAFAAELERLLATHPDGTFPHGEGVPVRTWVAWQRARRASEPASAVGLWQALLEQHGSQDLGGATAATLARAAIDALIARHGPGCYREVQVRADAALAAAGDDQHALANVTVTFPNSPSAERARARLLDAAVRAGDLAVACSVLAQGLATGHVTPGVARRVMVAAVQAGNHGLAQAMADRLRLHADQASDWPDDAGRTFGQVLADPAALPKEPATVAPPQPPLADQYLLKPTSDQLQTLLPLLPARGFASRADTPLYVQVPAERELRAIDLAREGDDKPVLFRVPIQYLEHAIVCGDVLVVPDMDRLFAVDYRTGAPRWELPNPRGRYLDSLGLMQGVLHVSSQPRAADGDGEFLGIEPRSGAVLFKVPLPPTSLKPKAIDDCFLMMSVAADGSLTLTTLDPVSGTSRRTVTVAASTLQDHVQLQADSLSTRLFPQSLSSDGERIFLPVDSAASGDAPRLLAIGADGKLAWHWRGNPNGQLIAAARAGTNVVLVEGAERRETRLVLLRASDGTPIREVNVGHDAVVLNWERSWLANPAPATLAIESFADADRSARQLVCADLADAGATFALPLNREDGEVAPTPQFGDDFVAFATCAGKGAGTTKLWVLSRRDRSGLLPGGRKHRPIANVKGVDLMTNLAGRVVVAGADGILMLGPNRDNR